MSVYGGPLRCEGCGEPYFGRRISLQMGARVHQDGSSVFTEAMRIAKLSIYQVREGSTQV